MSVEIEAKLKVDSLEEIERGLVERGAEFLAQQLQTDYYFDDTDRTLTKGDRCLRLRREQVDNGERFFLTYKGAKEKSNLKKRQEIDIELKGADSTEELLSALGYKKAMVFEKRRRLWQVGQCLVALDELPLLGGFVEIEGPSEEKISDVQGDLGLANLPHITQSYALLIEEKLRQLGKKEREVFLTKARVDNYEAG